MRSGGVVVEEKVGLPEPPLLLLGEDKEVALQRSAAEMWNNEWWRS